MTLSNADRRESSAWARRDGSHRPASPDATHVVQPLYDARRWIIFLGAFSLLLAGGGAALLLWVLLGAGGIGSWLGCLWALGSAVAVVTLVRAGYHLLSASARVRRGFRDEDARVLRDAMRDLATSARTLCFAVPLSVVTFGFAYAVACFFIHFFTGFD